MVDFEWTPHYESCLLEAMIGLKPVGISKYFQMIAIMYKFEELTNKSVPVEKIWEYLGSLYNLAKLDETEAIVANVEKDFTLPTEEFEVLMQNHKTTVIPEEKPKTVVKKQEKEFPSTPVAVKKEEKKEASSRRDSKDSSNSEVKTPVAKKEIARKEPEKLKTPTSSTKPKVAPGSGSSSSSNKLDMKRKRSLRGSGKVEESPTPIKRRRI